MNPSTPPPLPTIPPAQTQLVNQVETGAKDAAISIANSRPVSPLAHSASASVAVADAGEAPPLSPHVDGHHLDCCLICGGIGEVLMCDTCPFVFHLRCVGLRSIPRELWSCDVCLGRTNIDSLRQERQERRRLQTTKRRRGTPQTTANGHADGIGGEQQDESINPFDTEYGPICAFCRIQQPTPSSGYQMPVASDPRFSDEQFLGPWYDEDRHQYLYVHRSCAMWSPRVFVRDKRLQNVVKEVQRARWLSCAECGKRGASIGCHDATCHKSYHYRCAIQAQCCMQIPAFTLHCPNHAIAINLTQKELLPPPLLQLRLDNTRNVVSGENVSLVHQPLGNPRRMLDGYYQTAPAYANFLKRASADLARKEARFAHLVHLPYEDRKRAVRAELKIQSWDEEEKERMERVEKRKRRHEAMMDQAQTKDEASPSTLVKQPSPSISSLHSTGWSMIGGLHTQIQSLKECVLLPMVYPELFTQLHIQPPRGMILTGPPGTGH